MGLDYLEYEPDGFIVGLTGGIACGKTTAANILAQWGWSMADTDHLAHEVMKPGGAAYEAVIARFGKDIVLPNGSLDRRALAERVFRNEDDRMALNELVHPHVRAKWMSWRQRMRSEKRVACVIIPLLFEVNAVDGWNTILCLAAKEESIRARLRARGLTDDDIQRRLKAQWPVEEKMKRADYVIENDGSTRDLELRLHEWSTMILKKER